MRARGYTLIDLLVTLGVAAVLLGMAVPGFQQLLAASRATAAINQITGAVAFARSEAILKRRLVTLCPAADGECLGAQQWNQGAMVFVDGNGNGQRDGGDHLARALPPLRAGERVYWRSFQNKSYLQFRPRGYTNWQNGSFLYCPPDDQVRHARMAIVNAAGRVRMARDKDGNGVVETANGKEVECPP